MKLATGFLAEIRVESRVHCLCDTARGYEWLIRLTAWATPRALYFKSQISNLKSRISNSAITARWARG